MDSFEKYEQKPDKAPFKSWEKSVIEGYSSEFFTLPEHPELVIRKIVPLAVKEIDGKKTAKKAIEYWTEQSKIFQNFADKYGIRMAKTSYFVGNDLKFKSSVPKESRPVFMAATERILGKNLRVLNSLDEKALAEIDALFSGLFLSLYDAYNESGYTWEDFNNSQVMYGTAENDTEPHVYIVDVDPLMKEWNEPQQDFKEMNFWNYASLVFSDMEELKKRIVGENKNFEKADIVLTKIISEMPEPADNKARKLRFQIIDARK
ncbi:MAG: hypothetical protein NT098_02095 [Candidatus Parcubacteria bacterium]|nr:hypothetical protein [Candidatus Parcubacteria bacterium]